MAIYGSGKREEFSCWMSEKVEDLDLYLLLEVSPRATKEEIKKAYHKKSIQCHPDKNPGNPRATQEFQVLLNAYTILSDEDKRRAYDINYEAIRDAQRQKELRRQREEAQRRKREKEEAEREKWGQWEARRQRIEKERKKREKEQRQREKHIKWMENLMKDISLTHKREESK